MPESTPPTAANAPKGKLATHRKNVGLSGIVQLVLLAIVGLVTVAIYLFFWQ